MDIPRDVKDAEELVHKWFSGSGALSNIPEPPPDTLAPPYIVNMALLTIFGLEWDGSDDKGDQNPGGTPMKGAWGAETHNKSVIGCALPEKLLLATFGALSNIMGYTCGFYSHVTQKQVDKVDIVDIGPAAWTHRLCDGTYGLHAALGHIEYGEARWHSLSGWPAGFYVAFWINDPQGHAIPIKGVNFAAGRLIGT